MVMMSNYCEYNYINPTGQFLVLVPNTVVQNTRRIRAIKYWCNVYITQSKVCPPELKHVCLGDVDLFNTPCTTDWLTKSNPLCIAQCDCCSCCLVHTIQAIRVANDCRLDLVGRYLPGLVKT